MKLMETIAKLFVHDDLRDIGNEEISLKIQEVSNDLIKQAEQLKIVSEEVRRQYIPKGSSSL